MLVSSRDGILPVIPPRDGNIDSRVVSVTLRKCACVHAKSLQLGLTLCDPLDCSLPGFSVPGILQTRMLEGVAIHSSRDLPNLGIEPVSLMSPALAGGFFTTSTTWESPLSKSYNLKSLKQERLFALLPTFHFIEEN